MKGAPPRILKKGTAGVAAAARTPEEAMASAREGARQIVAAAEAEAERMRAALAEELLAARAAAAEEGYAEGRGRAAALLARAIAAREARLAEVDGAVVEIALEVAQRIVRHELAIAPAAVLDMARRALRAAAGRGEVVLRAAPEDLALLRGSEEELWTLVEGGALTLTEDPALARGEVIVESLGGRVDGRIEAQLGAFRRALGVEGR